MRRGNKPLHRVGRRMLFGLKPQQTEGGREGGGRRGWDRVKVIGWAFIYSSFVYWIDPSLLFSSFCRCPSLHRRTENRNSSPAPLLSPTSLNWSSPPSFSSVSFIVSSSFLYQGQVFVSPPPVSAAHSLPLSPLSPYEYSTFRQAADRCGGFCPELLGR